MRRSAIALALLAALALLGTAPAGASTIVYTCGANLCAVEPDGSKQRRLTETFYLRGSICWVGMGGGKVRCPIRDRENVWEPSWGG